MATVTIVLTYTPAPTTSTQPPAYTSMTVDGTAYASLTADQIAKARMAAEAIPQILSRDNKLIPGGFKNFKVTT